MEEPSSAAFRKLPGREILAPDRPRSARANTSHRAPDSCVSSLPPHCEVAEGGSEGEAIMLRTCCTGGRTAACPACRRTAGAGWLWEQAEGQSKGIMCGGCVGDRLRVQLAAALHSGEC